MSYNDDEKKLPKAVCRKCKKTGHVVVQSWDSSDGAYTDYRYDCKACKATWWIDGPDA